MPISVLFVSQAELPLVQTNMLKYLNHTTMSINYGNKEFFKFAELLVKLSATKYITRKYEKLKIFADV